MNPPQTPKALLGALLEGARVEFPAEAVEKARSLARAPAQAKASEVEALPEPLALAVLEAAVKQRATSLPEALAGSSAKGLAKAAKKALYQLRSLGVAVTEKPEPAAAAAPTVEAPESLPCLITPVTGNGEQGLIMGRAVRGGIETLQTVFSDELGIVQLANRAVSRSTYRSVIREPKERQPPVAIDIAPEQARARLADAAARNLSAKTPFPEGTEEALRHFGVIPTEHPLDLPAPGPEDARLSSESGSLHDEPEIRSWLPPVDALTSLALKSDEITTSQLYINDAQRKEQLAHQTRSSAEAFFTPQMRRLYAGRLQRMSDYFRASNRARAADIAAAEARRLFHGAEGLSPFGLRMFDKVLEMSLRLAAERAAEAGVPAEAEQAEAPAERRSPGGLILP